MKYKLQDIQIGDTVVTNTKSTGKVIAVCSYSYLNDRYIRQQSLNQGDPLLIDLMPFKFDETRHQGMWYQSVIISTTDNRSKKPIYYLEGIDVTDIREVIKADKPESLWQKIKKFFKKIFKA